MRTFFWILTLLSFVGCATVEDCLQHSGDASTTVFEVGFFNKIDVQAGIGLVLKQSDSQMVTVHTRTQILEHISVEVIDEILVLKQNESCFWNQSYGKTEIVVEIPDLIELKSTTGQDIFSEGVLSFNDFTIITIDASSGNFYLQLNTQSFRIETNSIASFFLSGNTDFLNINYYAGIGRCDAAMLTAQEINIFHRGTNDIIVSPIAVLRANLYSTGNLLYNREPAVLDVNSFFSGQLIFQP